MIGEEGSVLWTQQVLEMVDTQDIKPGSVLDITIYDKELEADLIASSAIFGMKGYVQKLTSLRRLGQKGRWRQCQGGEAKAGKGKAGILPGVANGSTDGLPADRVANGWTYGLPAYGGAGWVSQCGIVHDRFAHMKMRRYDYYSACSDGCFFCVWQMINSHFVTGYELSNVAGYSGLDFLHDARRRGVDTTSLEVYFKAQEVKAKTQTETHLRDSDL